tara:strand:- start:25 stop:294 length:270 start_codon:yes stop_codon:yes gene_type:complete
MTGSSSNQDNSHMAEMAADLFEAKMAAKDASKGMTHLLKIGQFHLEIVPDKDIDIVEVFDGILANLHERYGDKLLLGDKVLMSQAGMHG